MVARVGFEAIEIAILDDEGKVTVVHEINAAEGGAISASISGIGAQVNTTFASDVPFFVTSAGVGNTAIELEIADLSYEALADITGMEIDDEGIMAVGSDTRPPYCALILKSHTKEGNGQYFALLKAKGSYDTFDLNTQEDGGPELNTDSITFTGVARSDKKVFAFGTKSDKYDEFKAFVFPTDVPAPPTNPITNDSEE